MLVLSRGPQDKILFPRLGICVEVLRIANRQVRLGITAPKDVKIAREESYAAQLEQELDASQVLDSLTVNRISSANRLIQEAKQQLAASNSSEAMRLLNLALAEFDNIDHEQSTDVDSVQETKLRYNSARQILLLDDNDRSRQTLSQVLRLKGFDVTEVNDSFRAVYRLAGRVPVDAVIVDTTTTNDHSQAILRQMSGHPTQHEIPVFAISHDDSEDSGAVSGYEVVEAWFSKASNPLDVAERLLRYFAGR